MKSPKKAIPDHTAVRVALWRALHVQVDPAPHVLEDEIGLQFVLSAPGDSSWRQRPDMQPGWTRGYRAAIVARARFIEDLVVERARQGVGQYVILGAGLDSFAQRRPEDARAVRVFEIDQPETQAWKQKRLLELGLGVPGHLQLVPVDFEAGESWLDRLISCGFRMDQPAVVASTGVAMYLTREANLDTLRQVASLATGSAFAMSYMLKPELIDAEEREKLKVVAERAREAGTPFLSYFSPEDALALAREAGFRQAQHVSRDELIRRYFAGRSDGLVPASGEEILVASS